VDIMEDSMRFLGSVLFQRCKDGECEKCEHYEIVDEKRPAYVECACAHHEAAINGAWREDRDVAHARKNEFIANVEEVFGGKIGA